MRPWRRVAHAELMSADVLHLSHVVGGALRDGGGGRLGRVDDLIVRLDQPGYPPITGALASVAGRHSYVPAERVATLAPGAVTLDVAKLDLRPFERRPHELLLRKDVLDRQLINVDGARLVRANEIELARVDGWWRVVGVDTGPRGALRRLLPRRLAGRVHAGAFLDWASVEPFVGHVPTLRLRVPHPRLARLHPAQIADLVEAASHAEGEEIIAAVHADRELEADVFEELDPRHQVEFIEERSDAEVAEVLGRMGADDAADLLVELPASRQAAVLERLSRLQRRRVGALSGYDPATAGGLMSPDAVVVDRHATVAEAQAKVRASRAPAELTTAVFAVDSHGAVDGWLPVAELLRRPPDSPLVELLRLGPTLATDASLEEVARVMADYNLTAAPVVDTDRRLLGVVTVDDVLEVMLPVGWRRRFGLLGDQ
jgi:CBS domain-containing protein